MSVQPCGNNDCHKLTENGYCLGCLKITYMPEIQEKQPKPNIKQGNHFNRDWVKLMKKKIPKPPIVQKLEQQLKAHKLAVDRLTEVIDMKESCPKEALTKSHFGKDLDYCAFCNFPSINNEVCWGKWSLREKE